jgi:hypothetical protein
MWSAAVFEPALPARSLAARNSLVLSHHTPSGWNPKVRLNVAAAFSFSLWLITMVASVSSTIRSSRSVPATLLAGTPSGSWDQTWRRTRARAFWILFNRPGVTSSSARHTVGADATRPSTLDWWRSTSMSAIASPAVGEHHRDVGQHPAAVVTGDEVAADHHLGQLGREADPVGQKAGGDAARMGHHADTIGGHGQAGRPRSTLHLRSAFRFGDLESSQTQVSLAGQALPCFHAPITPESRERSGLVWPGKR